VTLLAVLISEHSRGRRFIEEMKHLLDAHERGDSNAVMVFTTPALQYIDLYRSHIWKENMILFTMAEEKIPSGKLRLIDQELEVLGNAQIPADTLNTFHETAEKLSKIYLGS
jgi:hemerythrin-like domain-containing protein